MSLHSGFREGKGRRLAVLGGLVALTAGLSGFFMGIRQTQHSSSETREAWSAAPVRQHQVETFPEAPRYDELPAAGLQANSGWSPHLGSLVRAPQSERLVPVALGDAERARLSTRRVGRRQYDGAPPVAPHPVDQRSSAACLECHGKPTRIGAIDVPQMSHAAYTNCIQCHVSSVGPSSWWLARNESLAEGNAFAGRGLSGAGARAYAGAPPVIPHTTWMRENCMSCHGPGGTVAMRTSHPDRQSCTQCHAPNAGLDQRLASGLPPPLPLSEWRTGKP